MARARDSALHHLLLLAAIALLLLLLAMSSHATVLPVPPSVPTPSGSSSDPRCRSAPPRRGALAVYPSDMEQLQFLLNAKFIEAEWFLHAALGRGLDYLDRNLSGGGPRPTGLQQKPALDFRTTSLAAELGYQEAGHIRAIRALAGGFPRPPIDLSADRFATVMDAAMGARLDPPFDAYASPVNFLLASYLFPHVTAAAAMGIGPTLMGFASKRLQAGVLAVEAGQDAVIRLLLHERADEVVAPYGRGRTVAEFTRRISAWRNRMSGCGEKDEGVKVLDRRQGAERRTVSNVLGAGEDSLGFQRTPAEVLRILYGSQNEQVPGGFLPRGANGTIARGFFQLA